MPVKSDDIKIHSEPVVSSTQSTPNNSLPQHSAVSSGTPAAISYSTQGNNSYSNSYIQHMMGSRQHSTGGVGGVLCLCGLCICGVCVV